MFFQVKFGLQSI